VSTKNINDLYDEFYKHIDNLYTITAETNPKLYNTRDADDLSQILLIMNTMLPNWLMLCKEAKRLAALRKAEHDALDYLAY
jgi:hypothetical protein